MKEMRLTYPIPLMCRVLEASLSGYYAWLNRKPSPYALEEMRLEVEIKAAHKSAVPAGLKGCKRTFWPTV
jgi:uncharacterized iron-regulated membrane protein